jgi:hypothetical protein
MPENKVLGYFFVLAFAKARCIQYFKLTRCTYYWNLDIQRKKKYLVKC